MTPNAPELFGPRDFFLAGALSVAAALASWILAGQLAFSRTHLDVWFESDSVYVLEQLVDRRSEHNDTNSRHPLYPLLGFGSVWVLDRFFGIARTAGSEVLLLTVGGVISGTAFLAMRLLGRPRAVALLGTAAFLVSSPSLLFLGVHERTIAGGASIFACALVGALYRQGLPVRWLAVGAAALALGITVTNFISAVLVLVASLGRHQAVRVLVAALVVVQVLTLVVVMTFPLSTTFPHIRVWRMSSVWSDTGDILARAGNWQQKSTSFWTHSIALPEPGYQYKTIAEPPMHYVSYQKVGLQRRGATGQLAIALWLAGLASAVVLAIRLPDLLERAFVAALAAQAGLFLLFGEETILYSPYYVPLAILAASRAVAEWWPYQWVRVLSLVFVVALTTNNLSAFIRARDAAIALL